jgi:glycosyltransferase involved in cell wall biosynthesis
LKYSIIIPTYNRRHVIGGAIDSALAQGRDDLEVVVVDDGSSDGTEQWLAANYVGQPVRILRNNRAKGPAGARNTGIIAAKGDFVALLDSDDRFLPGHLADSTRAFVDHAAVDVIFGRALYERHGVPEEFMGPNFELKLSLAPSVHDDTTMTVFAPEFFDHLLQYGCWFNLSTVVLRATAARELMNEALRISEDYEFWVRLSRRHRFACLHAAQIRYALHDENISFEAGDSTASNAPRLLQALGIMLAYSDLTRAQRSLIRRQMADVLFDWAYRSREHRHFLTAARLHCESFAYGRPADNLLALLKLPMLAISPGVRAR